MGSTLNLRTFAGNFLLEVALIYVNILIMLLCFLFVCLFDR